MAENNIPVELLHRPVSLEKPNVLDHLRSGQIDLVINIPKNYPEENLASDDIIRRTAVGEP